MGPICRYGTLMARSLRAISNSSALKRRCCRGYSSSACPQGFLRHNPSFVGLSGELVYWSRSSHTPLVHRSIHQHMQVRDAFRGCSDDPLRHLRFRGGRAV